MSGRLCAPYLKDSLLWQRGSRSSLGTLKLSCFKVEELLLDLPPLWRQDGGSTWRPSLTPALVKQSILLFHFMLFFPLCAGLALSSSLLAAGTLLRDGTLGISESPSLSLNMRSVVFQSVLAYGNHLNF